MSDLPFELARQKTYAALSPSDLETMGRQASEMYLCKEASLNDAVVKLAGQHPSISPDQVKRVVEFANQNTFQALFEKQAGADQKNVDFDIADPGVVLRDLNDGARPAVYHATPAEYGQEPVKLGHKDVQADLVLMEMFGVTPTTPALRKVAADLSGEAAKKGLTPDEVNPEQLEEGEDVEMEHTDDPDVAQRIALDHLTELPDYYTRLAEMEEEGKKELGLPEEEDEEEEEPETEDVAEFLRENPSPSDDEFHDWAEDEGFEPDDAEEVAYRMAAETAKQASAELGIGGFRSDLLLEDLRKATSIGSIKEATSRVGTYATNSPHNELVRAYQRLTKLSEDATYAVHRGTRLIKEATDRFTNMASQAILGGTNIGEMAHALEAAAPAPEWVKVGMQHVVNDLITRGVKPAQLDADLTAYQMVKGASVRIANPDSPLVQAFGDYVRVLSRHDELVKSAQYVGGLLKEVTAAMSEAARSQA